MHPTWPAVHERHVLEACAQNPELSVATQDALAIVVEQASRTLLPNIIPGCTFLSTRCTSSCNGNGPREESPLQTVQQLRRLCKRSGLSNCAELICQVDNVGPLRTHRDNFMRRPQIAQYQSVDRSRFPLLVDCGSRISPDAEM